MAILISDNRYSGIDIEWKRPVSSKADLIMKYFCDDEIHALQNYVGETSDSVFLCMWTRKESMLKAYGCGLTGNLKKKSTLALNKLELQTWVSHHELIVISSCIFNCKVPIKLFKAQR